MGSVLPGMEYKTKVSTKGQVVIPKELREKYGYREGVEVTMKPVDDERIILERVPKLSELFELLGEAPATELLLREREQELPSEKKREAELQAGRRK